MSETIGFISTRFAGTDGVSLESAKWADVLTQEGHNCFWYGGRLDRSSTQSYCVPEAFFNHPENVWINQRILGKTSRTPLVTSRIRNTAEYLKETLYDFIHQFEINILILENVLSIPMHVPLGVALTELLAESRFPAIAHHHDFYWERTRYSVNAVADYFDMAFPPRVPGLQHVVINIEAQEELARRKAVPSMIIPNVMDFEHPPPLEDTVDTYTSDLFSEIGLNPDDIMILQPTRIVQRKGIEHAITLVRMLDDPKYKLVVSHEAGDEGMEYRNMISEYARQSGVDMRFFATRVSDMRHLNNEGRKMYTIWDLYMHADLVTYPSLSEGFGNALMEAVYFKRPVLINRYAIFGREIEPKGFRIPIMEGFLTQEVVDEVRRILENPVYRREIVNHNYRVASRYYSYDVLRRCLRLLIANIRGHET